MTRRRGLQGCGHSPGFTLIEVLGAVAILAILYTTIAGVAIQAFRAEGESRRRMEASLLADERLTALEAASALGAAPALGEEIEEVEIFRVETQVRAADAWALGFGNDPEDEAGMALLFESPDGSEPAPLREIEILVSWSEGDRELEVRRATYALDNSSLVGLFGVEGTAGDLDGREGSRVGDAGRDSRRGGSGSRRGGSGGGGSGGRGSQGNKPAVDCNSPCPAKDVDCLMQQLSSCS